ncbi:MAG: type III secretion inner membrane ring lipoprotein SctJ [Pseudomonadota bacterium]
MILLLASSLCLSGCLTELYSGLSEREANEMLALLLRQDIPADKQLSKEGAILRVESARFAKAIELLQQNGYPRENFAKIGELFKKQGMISSPLEERMRYLYALSQQVSSTLAEIDGVLSARVQVVVPERTGFGDKPVPSSAAVFIKHRPELDLSSFVSRIKVLVSNSIEGLSYDQVSIALFPALPAENAPASPAWQELLSLRLAPESMSRLWWMLSGGVFLLILLMIGNGVGWWLWWQTRKTPPPPAA